jgi:preprotein translocase subunit YajC
MVDLVLAMARPSQNGAGSAPFWVQLVPFALIFVIFYVLLIRPQARRQREHQEMVKGLSKGDEVLTQGGLYGVVVGTSDDVVVLRVAENTKVEVAKSSISGRRGKTRNG